MEILARGGDCDRRFCHGQDFTRPHDRNMIFIQYPLAIDIKFAHARSILAMTASAAYAVTPNFRPFFLMDACVSSGIEDHHANRDARIEYWQFNLLAFR
jgi:hypothetical protein